MISIICFINHFSFKLVFMIPLSILFTQLIDHSGKKIAIIYKGVFILLFIIVMIFLDIDQYFIKFKTIEECFHYYHSSRHIIEEIKIDNSQSLIVEKRASSINTLYFEHKDDSWYYRGRLKIKYYKDIKIAHKKLKNGNMVLLISYDENKDHFITDNVNTKFDEWKSPPKFSWLELVYGFYIIENVPSNYHLLIDGKKVKL